MGAKDSSVVVTETTSNWEDYAQCTHCGRLKRHHMEDGKCLFEASSFEAQSFPEIAKVAAWTFEAFKLPKPKKPYPERKRCALRKEQKLKMKAQKKGNRRR